MQLRVVFETGDKAYYWLNNVVAVGRLSSVEGPPGDDGESFWLRIDVWHVSFLLFEIFVWFWERGVGLLWYGDDNGGWVRRLCFC